MTLSRRRRIAADRDSLPSDLTADVILSTNHAAKTQIQALPEKLERSRCDRLSLGLFQQKPGGSKESLHSDLPTGQPDTNPELICTPDMAGLDLSRQIAGQQHQTPESQRRIFPDTTQNRVSGSAVWRFVSRIGHLTAEKSTSIRWGWRHKPSFAATGAEVPGRRPSIGGGHPTRRRETLLATTRGIGSSVCTLNNRSAAVRFVRR